MNLKSVILINQICSKISKLASVVFITAMLFESLAFGEKKIEDYFSNSEIKILDINDQLNGYEELLESKKKNLLSQDSENKFHANMVRNIFKTVLAYDYSVHKKEDSLNYFLSEKRRKEIEKLVDDLENQIQENKHTPFESGKFLMQLMHWRDLTPLKVYGTKSHDFGKLYEAPSDSSKISNEKWSLLHPGDDRINGFVLREMPEIDIRTLLSGIFNKINIYPVFLKRDKDKSHFGTFINYGNFFAHDFYHFHRIKYMMETYKKTWNLLQKTYKKIAMLPEDKRDLPEKWLFFLTHELIPSREDSFLEDFEQEIEMRENIESDSQLYVQLGKLNKHVANFLSKHPSSNMTDIYNSKKPGSIVNVIKKKIESIDELILKKYEVDVKPITAIQEGKDSDKLLLEVCFKRADVFLEEHVIMKFTIKFNKDDLGIFPFPTVQKIDTAKIEEKLEFDGLEKNSILNKLKKFGSIYDDIKRPLENYTSRASPIVALLDTIYKREDWACDMSFPYFELIRCQIEKLGKDAESYLQEEIRFSKSLDEVSLLIEKLKSKSADTRREAGDRLGEIKPTDSESLSTIMDLFKHKDAFVRRGAVYAFSLINPSGEKFIHAIDELLEDSDPSVRCAAIRAYRTFQLINEKSLKKLAKCMEDSDSSVRREAVITIAGLFQALDDEITDDFAIVIDDSDASVRIAVAEAIGSLMLPGEKIHHALAKHLHDSEVAVRRAVATAFVFISSSDENIHLALAKGLGDSDPYVRMFVIDALKNMKPSNKKVYHAIAKALGDHDSKVRCGAFEAILGIRPNDLETLTIIISFLAHEEGDVREKATKLLEDILGDSKGKIQKYVANIEFDPLSTKQVAEILELIEEWLKAK